jgi:UDP-hydrolysing UDP-N-acetyl-D-glucosamine 2-epimerase
MNKLQHIGLVTGTRAEYGLLSRTIELLQLDPNFTTKVFACGTHLSPEFGYTLTELETQQVKNIIPVEMLLSTVSRVGLAKSVGLGVMSFADAFSRTNIEVIIILGDRYEMLAAAQAAMFLGIPIIHIHGGEVTEGAFDDAIRHSITKMANVHFPATKEFSKRIQQLGESKQSIFVVGAPGIDNIINAPRMSKDELEASLGFSFTDNVCLVTYHHVTNTANTTENDIQPLVDAIKKTPDINYIITYPNADGGGSEIITQWKTIENLPHVHIVPSLGFKRYLSVMKYVKCVIGNSSSGIIEAPSFHVGTVNIGTRQKGRPRANSIIDVEMNENLVKEAILKCFSSDFIEFVKHSPNPYGDGGTAEKIIEKLSSIDINQFRIKSFMDISNNE